MKKTHYQICVSGAAKGASVEEGKELARELGAALARAGHSLLSGATIGLPNYAAEGYKAAGGTMSVGISPASTKVEHVMKYRLPVKDYDTILYTGLHYVGRDTLLITSSDAVVSIGGRLGTLHEFTIAMETDTPIGFLQGAGGVSEQIQTLMGLAHPLRHGAFVTFDEDADKLISELSKFLDVEHAKYRNLYE
ncbi:LOG family protein [Aeromicrobium sp.]|nr:LOG family protein [Candidatus Saccharibacteria bacterium]